MREAAGRDGIELHSFDTYRPCEAQNAGYQAFLRGEPDPVCEVVTAYASGRRLS